MCVFSSPKLPIYSRRLIITLFLSYPGLTIRPRRISISPPDLCYIWCLRCVAVDEDEDVLDILVPPTYQAEESCVLVVERIGLLLLPVRLLDIDMILVNLQSWVSQVFSFALFCAVLSIRFSSSCIRPVFFGIYITLIYHM